MYGLDKKKNFSESIYDIADEPVLATLFTTGNGYIVYAFTKVFLFI